MRNHGAANDADRSALSTPVEAAQANIQQTVLLQTTIRRAAIRPVAVSAARTHRTDFPEIPACQPLPRFRNPFAGVEHPAIVRTHVPLQRRVVTFCGSRQRYVLILLMFM